MYAMYIIKFFITMDQSFILCSEPSHHPDGWWQRDQRYERGPLKADGNACPLFTVLVSTTIILKLNCSIYY